MVIYKTTNLVNGKQYIGRDSRNNPNYLGSGPLIKKAIKKYGKENFIKEIIEECHSFEQMVEREEYWLNYYDAGHSKMFYNMHNKGSGAEHSDEWRRQRSILTIGENNPFYGKTHSIQSRKRMSKIRKGKRWSDEYKLKMSEVMNSSEKYKDFVETRRGKARPEHSKKMKELYASGKLVPHNLGKPNSPEARAKISAKNKGKIIPPDVRKKMGISKRKSVDMFDVSGVFLRSFQSIQEASDTMNIGRDSVYGCCIGKYRQGGGYIWKYSHEIK
jgi:group I intron endonuclease